MSIRQDKVSRLIQRDLGSIFQQRGEEWLKGKMISVTVVRVAPDLRSARVYVSIFPTSDPKGDLAKLKVHTPEIRKALGDLIRHQIRAVPELYLYLDDSLDYAERIDDLLDS